MTDAKIHPTAIVDPNAKIGADVQIGPFSIVGPDVTIGRQTIVQSHVVIEGEVAIGRGNFIGHGAIIGVPPQDVSFSLERKTKVEIGDDNIIREYCTIHRGSPDGSATKIGDKNFLMSGAHIGHNCLIGNNVVIANNCLLAGHVRVDDGAFLGGGSTFHQFMHIGRLVMVQGSSGFGKDLPPFVVAAERNCVFGLNIVGMRRAGLQRKRSRRNQGGIQTYLSQRTEHVAGSRESGDDDLWRTSARIPGLRRQFKKARHLPVETRRWATTCRSNDTSRMPAVPNSTALHRRHNRDFLPRIQLVIAIDKFQARAN